ncbi:hypothetical protein [Campylobacter gastrosuis]|uniref:Small hydrophobic protein n=1 Tax=Campylobacter gastrosuis TaxID=2974576 RepID=A0ABT7HQD5_9BACT|nr:hypothetical protein [Campylobacter gastrosuis]MDL0088609.1 hypothetical protein [Campylobacter gastrosuis]
MKFLDTFMLVSFIIFMVFLVRGFALQMQDRNEKRENFKKGKK